MTSEALREGKISEDSIKQALTICRGDLFLSSGYLSVSVRELDRYIRSSHSLKCFFSSIQEIKEQDGYDKLSNEQFSNELSLKTMHYKAEALDIIYDIATMQPEDGATLTAAQQKVRLEAAIQLRGSTAEHVATSDNALILQELNSEYMSTAKKIKSVRAIQIEYDND